MAAKMATKRSLKRSSSREKSPCPRPLKARKDSIKEDDTDAIPAVIPSDTEAAIMYLRDRFPTVQLALPPLLLKHQLYSIVHNKTAVDRDIVHLRDSGRVRVVKMDSVTDEMVLILSSDLCTLIQGACPESLANKVINKLLSQARDVSIGKDELMNELRFNREEISGVLVVRDVGKESSWWFSIPGISAFKKDLTKGRSTIMTMFKRSKHKEILQKASHKLMDFESKKISSRLPMEYYVHDLLGSEILESVATTSGPLLRMNQ